MGFVGWALFWELDIGDAWNQGVDIVAGLLVWCKQGRPQLRGASPLILCAAVTMPVCAPALSRVAPEISRFFPASPAVSLYFFSWVWCADIGESAPPALKALLLVPPLRFRLVR